LPIGEQADQIGARVRPAAAINLRRSHGGWLSSFEDGFMNNPSTQFMSTQFMGNKKAALPWVLL